MTSKWRLDGYRVLVTGSTKGIGYATAQEFIALGAEVIINGRNEQEVDTAVAALGANARGCVVGRAQGAGRREAKAGDGSTHAFASHRNTLLLSCVPLLPRKR